MRSRLFCTTLHTRFSDNPELKALTPIINELKTEVDILTKAKIDEKIPYGITYQKWETVSGVYTEINNKIDAFNAKDENRDPFLELKDVQELLNALRAIVNNLTRDKRTILNTQRNGNRDLANNIVQKTPVALTFAAACLIPLYFGPGVIATISAYLAGSSVASLTGLDDLTPNSAKIISKLDKKLDEINHTVGHYLEQMNQPVLSGAYLVL